MIAHTTVARVFGVELESPFGTLEHRGDWVKVGSVIVCDNGRVRVVPRHGVDGEAVTRLLAVAEHIAISGRMDGPEWRYHPALGWVVGVVVRAHRCNQEAAERQGVRL
ncbi:hypothetical protein [Nocardia brevicatena]|uniref:hypothetical protein n=1 Tax=Nocardia brevicatena TaxID=37327 RepID=UPI0002E733DC|nr:hypothetical protein [Nocardia brevicatena]